MVRGTTVLQVDWLRGLRWVTGGCKFRVKITLSSFSHTLWVPGAPFPPRSPLSVWGPLRPFKHSETLSTKRKLTGRCCYSGSFSSFARFPFGTSPSILILMYTLTKCTNFVFRSTNLAMCSSHSPFHTLVSETSRSSNEQPAHQEQSPFTRTLTHTHGCTFRGHLGFIILPKQVLIHRLQRSKIGPPSRNYLSGSRMAPQSIMLDYSSKCSPIPS